MAGGIGSRFWPVSRREKPKQFLDILQTGRTLLQQTYDRFIQICPAENIFVVTNQIYEGLVAEQLPELSDTQILGEPMRRNTAPCVAYANMKIRRRNPEARIVVAPSDHLILQEEKFIKTISEGLAFVSKSKNLMTLGITPSRPETGYGYIQLSEHANLNRTIIPVKSFTEKPDRKTAEMFIETGEFLWNSGIFIWTLESIDKAFQRFLPDIAGLFADEEAEIFKNPNQEKSIIQKIYSECRNISIDKGIMEYADCVSVLRADFGWSDLGTWDSLHTNLPHNEDGNALNSQQIICSNVKNSIIHISKDTLLVAEDLDGYIIAESNKVILICKKENESKIRTFVNEAEMKGGEKYL